MAEGDPAQGSGESTAAAVAGSFQAVDGCSLLGRLKQRQDRKLIQAINFNVAQQPTSFSQSLPPPCSKSPKTMPPDGKQVFKSLSLSLWDTFHSTIAFWVGLVWVLVVVESHIF